jgi:hypothetical protein
MPEIEEDARVVERVVDQARLDQPSHVRETLNAALRSAKTQHSGQSRRRRYLSLCRIASVPEMADQPALPSATPA